MAVGGAVRADRRGAHRGRRGNLYSYTQEEEGAQIMQLFAGRFCRPAFFVKKVSARQGRVFCGNCKKEVKNKKTEKSFAKILYKRSKTMYNLSMKKRRKKGRIFPKKCT